MTDDIDIMRLNLFSLNSRGLALGLFAAAVALGAFGVCFTSVAVQTSSLREFSRTWNPVQAEIVSVGITVKEGRPEPEIQYRFSAQGRTHESRRIFLAGGPMDDVRHLGTSVKITYRDAQNLSVTREFSAGEIQTAYVHPHNPSEAVLIREVLRDMKPVFFWGVGLLVIAAGFLLRSFSYN